MKLIDMTGQRYGRYVVLERCGSNGWRNTMWLCRCDCGTIKPVAGGALRSGNTKSCGCLSAGLRNKSGKQVADRVWRRVEKTSAILEMESGLPEPGTQAIPMGNTEWTPLSLQKLYWHQIKKMIHDIGLEKVCKEKDLIWDSTNYFKKGHRLYKEFADVCEKVGTHPDHIVWILKKHKVLEETHNIVRSRPNISVSRRSGIEVGLGMGY